MPEAAYLELMRWMHRASAPWLHECVRVHRQAARFQLSLYETRLILDSLRAAHSFLVFGVGRDSTLWAALGPRKTWFVEHDPRWISFCPALADRIRPTRYDTRVRDHVALLERESELALELPRDVTGQAWDVILVDGPQGDDDEAPGRMKSICAAARLVAPGGLVFVHDMDRPVEQLYTARFLGAPVALEGRLALFRAPGGRRAVPPAWKKTGARA